MEIVGKVVQLGNLTEGNGTRGAWKKQQLIIETIEQYPKKICLICWNDRVDEAQNFVPGQIIKAQVSIESREFNGKWYTDVRPFRFNVEDNQQAQQKVPNSVSQQQLEQSQNQDSSTAVTDYFETDNGDDDLPF